MLKFRLFGFPVAIQAFFFLTAYFIGPQHSVQAALLWIPAVFLGVLAHELGHAFAGRSFGLRPVILLNGFGGQTSWAPHHPPLSSTRKILLTAAGPGVGISIGMLIIALRTIYAPLQEGLVGAFASDLIWINLGWGLLNLFPVLPLDGGQIATTIAVSIFGPKGKFVALSVSLVLTISLGIWSAVNSEIWMTLLAIILTISNIRELGAQERHHHTPRKARPLTDAEKSYDLARSLAESGQVNEALNWLETAIHAGFNRGDVLDADPNWAALRQDPRFVSLRRRLSRAS